MGPGERRGRGGDAGAGVDPLGQQPAGRRGASPAQGCSVAPSAWSGGASARRARGEAPGASRRSARSRGRCRRPSLRKGRSRSVRSRGQRAAACGARAGRARGGGRDAPPRRRPSRVPSAGSPARASQRARGRRELRSDPAVRPRRSRCRGNRRRRSPGSRRRPRQGCVTWLLPAVPTARDAASIQPAASPWAARPSTGAPSVSNRAAAPRSRPRRKPTMRRASSGTPAAARAIATAPASRGQT